jgi:hypothetical protein
MPSSKKKTKHLLAMWDMQGLECIFDVDKAKEELDTWEKSMIFDILKEQPRTKKPKPIPLPMMLLRARVNSQRQYEIYEFNSEVSLSDVKGMFKTNPQHIVNWIRENGIKIYSDYIPEKKRVIA